MIFARGSSIEIEKLSVKFRFETGPFGDDERCFDLDPILYNINETNTLTLIFDMRPNQNVMFIKINNVIYKYAICNFYSNEVIIRIDGKIGDKITLISETFLKCLPISLNVKITYLRSLDGTPSDRIINYN
jgi:hypothetical protein